MAQLDSLLTPAQHAAASQAQLPLKKEEVKWAPDVLDDPAIIKLVTQDTQHAEGYILSTGWPSEWARYEQLYMAHVPSVRWEGTTIERAHLGVPLVYEHVESILPQVILGFFGTGDAFEADPRPGTAMEAARASQSILSWDLDVAGFREEFRLFTKQVLIYGTGIAKVGYTKETKRGFKYVRKGPQHKAVPTVTPTGTSLVPNDKAEYTQQPFEKVWLHPTFEALDVRHVLVDPGLRVPDIRKARYVIHRLYLNAKQLDALRDQPGYNIPTREKLLELGLPPKETATPSLIEIGSPLDVDREFRTQTPLSPMYSAQSPVPRYKEASVNPLDHPLEVLEYWTKDNVYTVLQRQLVIRKAQNEFGEIPFRSCFFSDLPNMFYSFGIARIVGNEQRLQQGVINTFLDDLALCLNTPFIRKRGANVPTQQLRMRPGGVIDTDDAEGVGLLQRQPLVMEVQAVLAASDARAQRHTAASEMVVQGSMPSSKSSVTRTATGVQALTSGTGSRLQYLIENLADQVLIPTLELFQKMNKLYLQPDDVRTILGELNDAYDGDPMEVVNAEMDFEIKAGARIQTRRMLGQFLPMFYQFFLQEPVIQGLQMQGKKLNMDELANMLFDVSGAPNRSAVIQTMNPDDEARMAAQNPAIQQIMAQSALNNQKLENQKQTIEEQNIGRAGQHIIKAMVDKASADGEPQQNADQSQ